MGDNGPYFIQKKSTKEILGADGGWYSIATILGNPKVLCKFETQHTARIRAKQLGKEKTQVLNQKTLKSRLRYADPVWEKILKEMKVGLVLDKDKKKAAANSELPTDDSAPEELPGELSAEPGSVCASETAIKASLETPIISETMDILEQLAGLALRWQNAKDVYSGNLRKLEEAIMDELHFVEFMELDTRRAYRSYKRLHDLRTQRRQLKNEQIVINTACAALKMEPVALYNGAQRALNSLQGLKTRKYAPRVAWPAEDDSINP